jgi:hypothetical protein
MIRPPKVPFGFVKSGDMQRVNEFVSYELALQIHKLAGSAGTSISSRQNPHAMNGSMFVLIS